MTDDEIACIKTLLILNGGNRSVDLEPDIFRNEELTVVYLRLLTAPLQLVHIHDRDILAMIYWYSKRVLKCRWIIAETRLMVSPHWIFYYSRDVIKGRWLEAESTISRDISYNDAYKDQFNIT